MLGSSIWAIVKTGLTEAARTVSLMFPAMYYSVLFLELSHIEEFRNKRGTENRCALLS